MRLLLDTHVFIWWDSDPGKLSRRAAELLADPASDLVLSVASVWEMQIKQQLGKLHLSQPLSVIVEQQQRTNSVCVQPVTLAHALAVGQLPTIHRDPFDRMQVAQAKAEQMVIVTSDAAITGYPVATVW